MTFALLSITVFSQAPINSSDFVFDKSTKAIKVTPLVSDENSSSFAILIKDKVAPHYHASHTETLLVIEGEAEMRLGDSTYQIKKGDFINIPPNTVHSVRVTSPEEWLKVISVQAPKFTGKDRVFVEE